MEVINKEFKSKKTLIQKTEKTNDLKIKFARK